MRWTGISIFGILALAGCGDSVSQSSLAIEKARAKVELCEKEFRDAQADLDDWYAIEARNGGPLNEGFLEDRKLVEKIVQVREKNYEEAKRQLESLLK